MLKYLDAYICHVYLMLEVSEMLCRPLEYNVVTVDNN